MIWFGIWIVPALLVGQVPPPGTASERAEAFRQERKSVLENEEKGLASLAVKLGEGPEATALSRLIPPPTPKDGASRIALLPEVVPASSRTGLANIPTAKSPQNWQSEADGLRAKAAGNLFDLATKAAKAGHFSLADTCLREVIARQPDHAEARRILGYVRHNGGWATPYVVKQLERGLQDHPTYGWVEASWIPHLEKGELPAPGRPRQPIKWVSANDANAARTRFEDGWEIQTEHFLIKTNVKLTDAIGFGRRLEALDDVFLSLMVDAVGSDRIPLIQRFRSNKPDSGSERRTHKVFYFATRQEFLDHLRPRQGNSLDNALGFYDDKMKTSYFYYDPNPQIELESTLYHEASHQLLFEIGGKSAREKNSGQYWVFEGLGTYFETLILAADMSVAEIGGPIGPRLAEARRRLVDQKELIPIDRFVAMDQNRFNSDLGDIYLNYAQAMALTVFLMQHDSAASRDEFLEYVKDAYRGRVKKGASRSLEDRVGLAYPLMAGELVEYLKTIPPLVRPGTN